MIRFEIKPPVIEYVLDEIGLDEFEEDDAVDMIEQIMTLMIAHDCISVTPEPMKVEDEIFGDQLIYCNQHLKVHETGWCSVSVRDKVGLGTKDHKEAVAKCREWGFRLHSDPMPVTPAPDAALVDKLQRANHLLSGSVDLLHADIDKGNEMIAALVEALKAAKWELQGHLEKGTAMPIIDASLASVEQAN